MQKLKYTMVNILTRYLLHIKVFFLHKYICIPTSLQFRLKPINQSFRVYTSWRWCYCYRSIKHNILENITKCKAVCLTDTFCIFNIYFVLFISTRSFSTSQASSTCYEGLQRYFHSRIKWYGDKSCILIFRCHNMHTSRLD